VRILANAVVITTCALDQSSDVFAIVPARLIGPDHYLRLDIHCEYIASPMTDDGQRLAHVGARLEKLLLELAEPPPGSGMAVLAKAQPQPVPQLS